MKSKKSAIEMEKVIGLILMLVVLAILLVLISKYGGDMYDGLKTRVMDVLSISNQSLKIIK